MLRNIILTGELAKRYGKKHRLNVSTPAEAIRALSANYPDFAKFVSESEQRNVAYKVLIDKEQAESTDRLHEPFSRDFKIVPVIGGAKKGGFVSLLIGAALIASAFFLPASPLLAGGVLGTGIGASVSLASLAFSIGVSLALSGVSQLLSPQPKAPSPSERPENQPSYVFDGPINTTAQGQAIPVGYGRLIVGSAVISAGITADDYAAAGLA